MFVYDWRFSLSLEFIYDQSAVLIFRALVFCYQKTNVIHLMRSFMVLDFFVMSYLGVMAFTVSSYD